MYKDLNSVSLDISKLFVRFATVPVTNLVYIVFTSLAEWYSKMFWNMIKCFPNNMI